MKRRRKKKKKRGILRQNLWNFPPWVPHRKQRYGPSL
jgi:hypothetical protein